MTPRRTPPRLREILAVAGLLVAHWTLAVTSSLEKSPTFDEGAHLVAGYLYWTAGDYRFNPESGVLPQRWAALPLLLQEIEAPGPGDPARRSGNVWVTSRQVLFELGNDADSMLLAGRAMIALLGVALGGVVYLWSRHLFGVSGGLLSLVLYAWSPTMLAHARMVTADLAAALFFLLGVGAIGRLLARVTPGRLLAAGGAVAGLVLAKTSWLLVLPMAALLAGGRALRRVPWTARIGRRSLVARTPWRRLALAAVAGVVVGALVVAIVWTAYGWRFRAAGDADVGGEFVHGWESRLAGAGGAAPAIRYARDHRLLPEAFLWGTAYTLLTTRERDAFLCGEYRSTGWRVFFPFVFLVKTPLPLLALLALAAWRTAGRRRDGPSLGRRLRRGLDRTGALWVLLAVYGVTAIASPLNLGHRHLLPLYPVLFILAGRAWRSDARAGRAAGVVVLVGLFVVESWLIRPHYLSYFNLLIGGPANAYRCFVDSSLDWGQDLPALASELGRRGAATGEVPAFVAYYGSAAPEYYGVEARWLQSYWPLPQEVPPRPLEAGLYGVSATLLQTLYTGRVGHWTAEREEEYRRLRREMLELWDPRRDPAARETLLATRSPEEWRELFTAFHRSRSVRLFHFLRPRSPAGRAGHSILIYHLSEAEVRRAVAGSPPASRDEG